MNPSSRTAAILIMATSLAALLGQGCPTSLSGNQAPRKTAPATPETPVTVPPAGPGQKRVGVPPRDDGAEQKEDTLPKASYEPFTQAAYDLAVANGEPIFLYFYANWCPFCKEQEPRNQQVFAGYTGFVRGFRVNYKDSDTDAAETALAAKFKITYQHTGVYLKNGQEEVKRTVGTEANESLIANLNQIAR